MTAPDRREKEIEELLPWYLNGTLDRSERRVVEEALSGSESLRQRLRETAAMLDLVAERPDGATLLQRARGALSPEENDAVDKYLRSAPDDAELVEMAGRALDELGEPSTAGRRQPVTPAAVLSFRERSSRRWQLLAAAASVIAVVASWGWISVLRDHRGQALSTVRVLELLPEELVVRGDLPEAPAPSASRGSVALVLITELSTQTAPLVVSLRDRDERELARLEGLSLAENGTVSVLVEAEQLSAAATLVLFGPSDSKKSPDAMARLGTYRLAPGPAGADRRGEPDR